MISSGESELISLAIEVNVFAKEAEVGKINILCLDEPDVHLHPDLQVKLMHLFKEVVSLQEEVLLIIATHSTALLNTLSKDSSARIAFKEPRENNLTFRQISEEYEKILPVFGAHPLTNIFNRSPILLVEGEDDVRIWQQAVRSAEGTISVYPCATDSLAKMHDYEKAVEDIAGAVYDDPKAYSLRDRDDSEPEIENMKIIRRFKLACRTSENLMLTDEVLANLRTDWKSLKKAIDSWLTIIENNNHKYFSEVKKFQDEGYDRMGHEIKNIRNLLMGGIIGSNKAWELAVGQVIASTTWNDSSDFTTEGSILSFLGENLVKALLKKT